MSSYLRTLQKRIATKDNVDLKRGKSGRGPRRTPRFGAEISMTPPGLMNVLRMLARKAPPKGKGKGSGK